MPIVLVCNAERVIVWADTNFCDVVDCERHPAIGVDLFDFLGVAPGDAFREMVAGLRHNDTRAVFAAQLRGRDGAILKIDFYVQSVAAAPPSGGASLISVGVQRPVSEAGNTLSDSVVAGLGVEDPMRQAYRYSNLRLEDGARLYAQLERLVDTESIHLNPNYTLEDAANRLSTNALYVSQVTNFFSGLSFPNYLNRRRLDALATALRERPEASLSELWGEAGFGSYSSLNRFLRNYHGKSPSEFAREARG